MKKPLVQLWMIVALFGVCGVRCGFAEDLADYTAQAKAKYSKYLKNVKDITIRQRMDAETPDGPVTQEATRTQKGNKYRVDLRLDLSTMDKIPGSLGDSASTVVFDGATSWIVSRYTGKKKAAYEESKKFERDSDLWDLLLKNGEAVREEMVGNYDCFVVEVKDKNKISYEMWIEKGTLHLIQAESVSGEMGKINFWNSDFRKVTPDWDIPYRTEIFSDGQLISTNIVKSTKLNQGLSDDLFNLEKIARGPMNVQDTMKE